MYSQIKFKIISLRKEMNLILGFEINSGFGDSWYSLTYSQLSLIVPTTG
jgi:hypothetical protein